eukprot:Hpha_TRINITY_DN17013_c6_g1::TRINITY_DN17013_c6_g1_i1::g.166058::m.166058
MSPAGGGAATRTPLPGFKDEGGDGEQQAAGAAATVRAPLIVADSASVLSEQALCITCREEGSAPAPKRHRLAGDAGNCGIAARAWAECGPSISGAQARAYELGAVAKGAELTFTEMRRYAAHVRTLVA